MKFTVPIPEKVSLNKIYAGIHFRQRSEHKSEYHMAVVCSPGAVKYEGKFPVAVHYHFRLAGSRLDISNHAYMVKMIEDGMVSAGVLPDDTPQYVSKITVTSEKIPKGEMNEVDVEFSPAGD